MALRQKLFKGPQPSLTTERLILRPFVPSDSGLVKEYLNNRDTASGFIRSPLPYEDWAKEDFMSMVTEGWHEQKRAFFALEPHDLDHMIGLVGLGLNLDNDLAELEYWLGEQFWGKGYATEAAHRILAFGFNDLDLQCVYGTHFEKNKGSGNVMKKVGMTFEGILRRRNKRRGSYMDLWSYSIIASEFHVKQTSKTRVSSHKV